MAQFQRDEDHLVEREEDWDLQKDRQAARGRVNLFLLVQLHHLLLNLLAVIASALLDLLHFGLKLFHLRHRDVGFISQREQDCLDDDGQADDRPAHVTDQCIQPVQNRKDRLGQEEEPPPIDRVDEFVDAHVLFVGADGFPFLGTRKEMRCCAGGRAGGNVLRAEAELGLIDVSFVGIAHDRGKGLTGFRDQRRHPVVVGKAKPAIFFDLLNVGQRRLAFVIAQVGDVRIVAFFQLAIHFADQTFVQDEEAFLILWLAVTGDYTIGGHALCGVTGVFDGLFDREHEVFVNRKCAAENQTCRAVPTQRDRCRWGQLAAILNGPDGRWARNIFQRGGAARCPAIKRVVSVLLACRAQQSNDVALFRQLDMVFL